MNQNELWEKSIEKVKIIRQRILPLHLFQEAKIPYVFFTPSKKKDNTFTRIRCGFIVINNDSLSAATCEPSIAGFGRSVMDNFSTQFFLIRGIHIPAFKYNHYLKSESIYRANCSHLISVYQEMMERKEETHTTLLSGIEECWQYCVLLYVFYLVSQTIEKDMSQMLKGLKNNEGRHELYWEF